ncbi:radical SAM superfamily-domain-containing protein [Apiospora rasikravindrae]|uniref:tRNA 4-demethylwyosine synthase (AdoMet-dependent) n=1 Tax=Apiospora rasikravindrae TaxID=990691 RepID=A0ABR1U0D9_9PEZI
MAAYEGWTSRLEAIGPVARAIDLWHAHRTPILLTVFGVLFSIWVYMLLTQEREYSVAFRKIYEEPSSAPVESLTEKTGAPVPAPAPAPVFKASPPSGPRRIKGEVRKPDSKLPMAEPQDKRPIQPLLFFSSLTGSTERLTKGLVEKLDAPTRKQGAEEEPSVLPCRILDLADIDYDEYFLSTPKIADTPVDYLYLLLVPSYNIDTINDTFLEHLKETHNDFRIDTAPLSGLLGYAVFGIGDREGWPTEDEGYCFQAKELDKWMAKLTGRKRAFPLGMADPKRDLTERLVEWTEGIRDVMSTLASTGSLGEGVPGSGDAVESDDEYASDDDGEVLFEEETKEPKKLSKSSSNLEDVEDLGRIMKSSGQDGSAAKAPVAIDFTTYGKATKKATQTQTVKEMVPKSSPTYASLTKQGYSIVGSHSGVKICRWTKSALRGRGSCYKFSFYGIASHQCMETTPSLSCSNKCVFCWRHGTNPVGTTWRWVVDPPELIFDGVKAGHYKKIKMMRGVPGVRSERFAEAMRIRHCALSLVGEPIFYPHINEFLGMLHAERISSFLVCNAQHPDQLAALKAVTQLYVSIDASNKESLRKIDRPLHRDFWERFQRCLDILREKRFKQRTVFRLTLVKGFNVEEEVSGYADLVERALPCFVEIKGVTYCGTSSSAGAGLSMANVPFYAEVTDFVTALDRKLKERGLDYGIAAEHAHSCCVLLASGRFRVNDKWHTRIDYQKFFELLEERGADGDWTPEEYMGEATPEWATWGNGGFDPRDERVDRKGRKIEA